MKTGDKIYCIKNNYNGTFDYHYKNNWYTIIQITGNITVVNSETNSWVQFFKNSKEYNFSDYFITLSEYRKQKLQKINTL